MAFLVSPGVQVKEIDLTNVVPATASSIGAIAAPFQWGPVEDIVTVGSETQLVGTFGKPNADTFQGFMQASQFLSYGNALRAVRVVGDAARNSTVNNEWVGPDGISGNTDDIAAVLVKNDAAFNDYGSWETGQWAIGKHPGVLGNALSVSICSAIATQAEFDAWTHKGLFGSKPGTSTYVSDAGGSLDEVHVVVIDRTGAISGTAGKVLESWGYLSQASDAKGTHGGSNYWLTVVNQNSDWIRVGDQPIPFTAGGSTASGTTFTSATDALFTAEMGGGIDANAATTGNLQTGYDLFSAEDVDVSLLIHSDPGSLVLPDGALSDHTMANYLIAIADDRKDCVAFVSPPVDKATAADVITWRNNLTGSSYAFVDSSALYVYDKYNDVYRWIAASGSIAGLAAHADDVADPWFSPAGMTRGNIRNVTKLKWNPTKADRDDLYQVGINPIVSFAGQGTILYGDKTLQTKPSAFDRINVRRLFITLEKSISTASRASLFEFNDEFTRAQFRNMVEPFLRDIKGRRGITDFKVVCDETNNTGDVIDTNRFVADIYIKPARSINFITLNFIATRSGVEFSEIVGGN